MKFEPDSTTAASGPPEGTPDNAAFSIGAATYTATPAELKLTQTCLDDLRKSGLSDESIRNGELATCDEPTLLRIALNLEDVPQYLGACLTFPYFDRDGKRVMFQRADGGQVPYMRVRVYRRPGSNGAKYLSPKGAEPRLYIVRGTGEQLKDVKLPLVYTEGAKKAIKAVQEGVLTVSIDGVDSWNKRRPKGADGKRLGERIIIDDIVDIPMKGRRVYLCFDFDHSKDTRSKVQLAEWNFAKKLRNLGAIVKIIRLPASKSGGKQGLDDYLVAEGVEAFRRLMVQAEKPTKPPKSTTKKKNAELPKPKSATPAGQKVKPQIILSTQEYKINEQAAVALQNEPDLYQRGGSLTHVIEINNDADNTHAIRRPASALMMRRLPPSILQETLTRVAEWVEEVTNKRGDIELQPCHPPAWCVKATHERGQWTGIAALDSIVTHPILMPDGTILAKRGYHPEHRLYASWPAALEINVPDAPTRADVDAAVAVILDVVHDVPFETPAHRGAYVAALLSPLAFFAHDGNVPLFLIDGNTRGVGKGLTADTIALIVEGRRFSTMAYTSDREELRKRITALAIEGESKVLMDNLAGNVGNDILDLALTSTRWKDRILGVSNTCDVPLHLCWYATGNNVQLHADTSRRTCHIRMETPEEKPETKTGFKYENLREHVTCNRSKLLSAALTILRGWVVAGRPKHGLTPWGSFEGWSSVVREAVVFAGLVDPGLTRESLQSNSDKDAINMTTILEGIATLDPDHAGVTAAQIITAVTHKKGDPPLPEWASGLAEAIAEMCGKLDSGKLGYIFRKFKRRTFAGGIRLESDDGKNGKRVCRWFVRSVNPKSAGERDEASPNASPADPSQENTNETASNGTSERDERDERDDSYPHTPAPAPARAKPTETSLSSPASLSARKQRATGPVPLPKWRV